MKFYNRCFALLLLVFSAAMCHAALQNGKLQVATAKGESSLTDPKSVKEIAVSGKLFEQGYKVETNKESTVELCLSNGSTLLLNPETLIEVRTFRQVASNLIIEGAYQKLDKEPSPSVVEILVLRGKIIGEVRKLNPQSSFTIKTPAGVARIRGTVYSVEYSENKSTRMGNMEIACVRGSVEFTVNGSNSGPSPVEPGKKVNAKAPIAGDFEKNTPEVKKVETKSATADQNIVTLRDSEGLKPGMKVQGAGLPADVEVVAVDPQTHTVTLNKTVNIEAGVQIEVVSTEEKTPPEVKKVETKSATVDQNIITLHDSEGLKPGTKIQGAGLPADVEVVAFDPQTHTVTLNKTVNIEAGVQITPVVEFEPPVIVTPVISVSRLEPTEISKISQGLASGTGLPPKLTQEIQNIADNTPPSKPTPPKEGDNKTSGGTTDTTDTKTTDSTTTTDTKTTDTTTTTTTGGGTSNTGGIKDITDAVTKTIQETIEKQNQTNPSPTQ